ncbi:MAG TPA: hypothetical protein VME70_08800 [Mycobacteriales bacterium]|nr:hypothetical protein [Mycobacteriales bacterium]
MSKRVHVGLAVGVATGLAAASVAMALPAGAAGSRTVKCHGTAEFCGASVSLAGGFSHRKVTIELTDTDFGPAPAAVRVIDPAASGSYAISKPRFTEGGSLYVFTLHSAKSNPRDARLVLLFSAGTKQPIPH